MKKIILFLLVIAGVPAMAQPYQSIFGKDSTSWVFEFHNLPGTLIGEAKISRDTLINDTAYKVVELNALKGFMREDTTIGKVWYRGEDLLVNPSHHTEPWVKEVLIFDYSLQPGDSFDVSTYFGLDTSERYSLVDSVKYINGRKYIYFDTTDAYWATFGITEQYVMIEGSGGNMGSLWRSNLTPNIYLIPYLLCYNKDGIKTGYENIRYSGSCNPTFMSVDQSDLNNENITVYPNPATHNIAITFEGKEQQVNIKVYDITGRMIISNDAVVIGNYSHQMDIGALAPGAYIVSIEDKRGAVHKFKVVKQ